MGSHWRQTSSSQCNIVECTAGCCFKGTGEFKASLPTSTHTQSHSRQQSKEWLLWIKYKPRLFLLRKKTYLCWIAKPISRTVPCGDIACLFGSVWLPSSPVRLTFRYPSAGVCAFKNTVGKEGINVHLFHFQSVIHFYLFFNLLFSSTMSPSWYFLQFLSFFQFCSLFQLQF